MSKVKRCYATTKVHGVLLKCTLNPLEHAIIAARLLQPTDTRVHGAEVDGVWLLWWKDN